MLNQAKVDLAVLCKLYEHAERGGEALTPDDLCRLFGTYIAPRRVEIALDELEKRGEVDREYHPHYSDEGLWQISRLGIATIERALAIPNTFIARLHKNGDQWLESDEAENAKLSKNNRYAEPVPRMDPPVAADIVTVTDPVVALPSPSARMAVDWTKWGTIIGGFSILVTILIAVFS